MWIYGLPIPWITVCHSGSARWKARRATRLICISFCMRNDWAGWGSSASKRVLHNRCLQNQNQCGKDDWGWSLFQHKIFRSSKSKQVVSKNKKRVLVYVTGSRHGECLAKECWRCSNLQYWTGLRIDINLELLNRQHQVHGVPWGWKNIQGVVKHICPISSVPLARASGLSWRQGTE